MMRVWGALPLQTLDSAAAGVASSLTASTLIDNKASLRMSNGGPTTAAAAPAAQPAPAFKTPKW